MCKLRKLGLSLILGLMLVLSIVGLTACGGDTVDNFKLSFVVDGQVYATIETSGNESVKIPENPDKTGYKFDGWYWDNGSWQQPFTANSLLDAPISSDMRVYAKFNKNTNESDNSNEGTQGGGGADSGSPDGDNQSGGDQCGGSQGHTHNYTSVVTAPTCTSVGYTTYTCACGDSYTGNEMSALGHKFTNYISNNDATYYVDGTETAICDRNGCSEIDTRIDIGSKLSHTHSYTSAITAPTCTEQGCTTYTCDCGNAYTDDETPALGHSYGTPTYQWNNDNSKCTATRVCLHDSAHIEREEVDSESQVTQNRTCVLDEFTKYTAMFENSAFTAKIKENVKTAEKLGHNKISHEAKATTCTEKGWNAYEACSRCDYTTYQETLALGHNYSNGSCTRCGDIAYSVKLSYRKENNKYTVTGIGTCSDVNIKIPSTYEGLPVTSIGYNAFYNCSSLTSITIPNSVTSIGDYAFYNCSSLTSVTFADTSTWYYTSTSAYTGGTQISVTNPTQNATYLKSAYYSYYIYYWYKK